EPEERRGVIVCGLCYELFAHARAHGYTHLFISGVEGQQNLYDHLGFEALGPAVRNGAAAFIPMAVTLDRLEERVSRTAERWKKRPQAGGPEETRALLRGPVPMTPEVRAAIAEPAVYHRDNEFIHRFEAARRRLGRMVGGRDVALLVGSGTLANETVGAAL